MIKYFLCLLTISALTTVSIEPLRSSPWTAQAHAAIATPLVTCTPIGFSPGPEPQILPRLQHLVFRTATETEITPTCSITLSLQVINPSTTDPTSGSITFAVTSLAESFPPSPEHCLARGPSVFRVLAGTTPDVVTTLASTLLGDPPPPEPVLSIVPCITAVRPESFSVVIGCMETVCR
jgi:hypothetical protein